MKVLIRIFFIIALSIHGISSFSQAPQGFKYQAVVRDGNGAILANQSVAFRIAIVQSGGPVYIETHFGSTNNFGLVNLDLGKGGATLGVFEEINWGGASCSIQVEVDPSGGTNFVVMGSSQLLSVPYALYANESGSGGGSGDADSDPQNEIQDLVLAGEVLHISGKSDPLYVDLTRYLDNTDHQSLTITGKQLSISNGNTVDIPSETDPEYIAWDKSTGISITESQISDFGSYEPAFNKKTAFNKFFGFISGTVAQGNDSRINNGQTAFDWGNHSDAGYMKTANNLSDLASTATALTNLGLNNVDNTSDANKPVSTATKTALDLKAALASPTFTGTPTLPTGTIATTQTAGNNTTALATTAFVSSAVTSGATPDATTTVKGKVQLAGDLAGTAAEPVIATGKVTSDKILDATIATGDLADLAVTDAKIATGISKSKVGLGNVDNTSDATKDAATATLTNKTLTSPNVNENVILTATSTELNVLDGVTSTTAELNYTDGVTSSIQTQLDAKAALASPTFTGTPTLPTGTIATTQTAGNNTTALATTAFVSSAVTSGATPDATTTVKGKVQLAGDLAGTAAEPVIATGKVTSDKILDATIATDDLADLAVTDAKIATGISKSKVGLGNVDNTSDATKDAATATLTNKTLTSPNVNENVILTATSTELNVLDGVTSTTAELNYTDGVTSAIQTQLDAKVSNATHTGDVSGSGALTIGDDKILEKHLKAVNAPTDEYILTYESTTGDFEWQAASSGGASELTELSDVSSSTKTAGNILVADGTNFASKAISGDATLASSGALTIANNSVDGTDIALGSDAQGDIMYYNGTDWVRLAAGTSGQILQTNGTGSNPTWEDAPSGSATNNVIFKYSDYTVQTTDGTIITDGGHTFTLPTAANAGAGKILYLYVTGLTRVTFATSGSDTIKDKGGNSGSSDDFFSGVFISDGVSAWYQVN